MITRSLDYSLRAPSIFMYIHYRNLELVKFVSGWIIGQVLGKASKTQSKDILQQIFNFIIPHSPLTYTFIRKKTHSKMPLS